MKNEKRRFKGRLGKETEILIQKLHKEGLSCREMAGLPIDDGRSKLPSRTTMSLIWKELDLKPHKSKGYPKTKEYWERETFNRWNSPTKNFETIGDMKKHFEEFGISFSYEMDKWWIPKIKTKNSMKV